MNYVCFFCAQSFSPKRAPANLEKPYCSKACAAKQNNKERSSKPIRELCKTCAGPMFVRRRLFCSPRCKEVSRTKFSTHPDVAAFMSQPQRVKARTKETERERIKKHYRAKKLAAVSYLGGHCQLCGYQRSVSALHFHHKDPESKEFKLSGRTISWDRMKAELDKCVLLCGNCHAEVHDGMHPDLLKAEELSP